MSSQQEGTPRKGNCESEFLVVKECFWIVRRGWYWLVLIVNVNGGMNREEQKETETEVIQRMVIDTKSGLQYRVVAT